MTRFTLDAKCLIELDGNGTAAREVAALVEAARQGQADVAIVASSSSRYHPGGARLARFADFKKRLAEVGLGSLSLLRPKAKHGFSFHGFGVLGDEAAVDRERLIFETLFPTTPVRWSDYAARNGLDRKDLQSPGASQWRSLLSDAQAFWAHENDQRDVFVTCDDNFRRLLRKEEFTSAVIVTPSQAIQMLAVRDEIRLPVSGSAEAQIPPNSEGLKDTVRTRCVLPSFVEY